MNDFEQNIFDTLKAAKADLGWLDGIKKDQLVYTIGKNMDAMRSIGFINGFRKGFAQTNYMDVDGFMGEVMTMVQKMPIDIDPTKVVFFSGTSQKRAEEFIFDKPDYNVIHTSTVGALLAAFQMFDPDYPLMREQRYAPWNALSARLAHMVRENATAILDVPKPTATFINYEMPVFLLENTQLFTINDMPKQNFWETLSILKTAEPGEALLMSPKDAFAHKQSILTKFLLK